MAKLLYHLTPKPLRKSAERFYRKVVSFGFRYKCPLCRSRLRSFKPLVTADYTRTGARRCPVCGSLERHRFVWLFLQIKTNLFDGNTKKMLHIAPERELGSYFQKIRNIDYLSGDLDPDKAMVKMDITDIQYPDEYFDVIYCCHVLEHVPEDTTAMREFYRVLRKGGWALIVVPVHREKTYEDSSITDPEQRRKAFGHFEHVRICGQDYADRLKNAGFSVTTCYAKDLVEPKEANHLGLDEHPAFFCRK